VVQKSEKINPGSCHLVNSCIAEASPVRKTRTEMTGRQLTEFTYKIVIAFAAFAFGL
jgi:hypothetical protein